MLLARTPAPELTAESMNTAISTFSTVAQAGADLVKVALGGVIGALGSTLQVLLSARGREEKGTPEPTAA